jgi:ATP/ADP translocase
LKARGLRSEAVSIQIFFFFAEISNMSDVKTLVRIVIALICLHDVVSGQTLTRRQQLMLQRQQKQVDQQQETLENQLLAQVRRSLETLHSSRLLSASILISPILSFNCLSQLTASTIPSQGSSPINHAVIDSIFNVSSLTPPLH